MNSADQICCKILHTLYATFCGTNELCSTVHRHNERMNICSKIAEKLCYEVVCFALHVKDSREFFSEIPRLLIDKRMKFVFIIHIKPSKEILFRNFSATYCQMNEFLFKMHIKTFGEFSSEISQLHIDKQINFCSKCT